MSSVLIANMTRRSYSRRHASPRKKTCDERYWRLINAFLSVKCKEKNKTAGESCDEIYGGDRVAVSWTWRQDICASPVVDLVSFGLEIFSRVLFFLQITQNIQREALSF